MTADIIPIRGPDDDGYDAAKNSALGYEHAMAALRLRVVIARAFSTFPFGNPGSRSVSGHIAAELIREWPGVIEAVRGAK